MIDPQSLKGEEFEAIAPEDQALLKANLAEREAQYNAILVDAVPSADLKPVYIKGKTARFEDKPEDRSTKYTTLGQMLFDGVM